MKPSEIVLGNDDFLEKQCNRYMNGECRSKSCLIRGGYSGKGKVTPDIATCEAHEILYELKTLRKNLIDK